MFQLKTLHDACPIPVQYPQTDMCVCAVCHYSWKKEDLAYWFAERATLRMDCARAVKPKMRVSESMLVAGPGGRYIW